MPQGKVHTFYQIKGKMKIIAVKKTKRIKTKMKILREYREINNNNKKKKEKEDGAKNYKHLNIKITNDNL